MTKTNQDSIVLSIEDKQPDTTKDASLDQASGFRASKTQNIVLAKAIVRVDQRTAKTTLRTPPFEFEVEFDREYDRNAPILEWLNCFWSQNEFNSRILRRATLKFDDTATKENVPPRTYIIDKAFIAFYEETSANNSDNPPLIKLIIRANDEDQRIDLSQDFPQEPVEDDAEE